MKETLKVLLKKDIRALLPGFVMFFMAGIALAIMCLFGIFTGNGDFTVTALYIFFYAIIIVLVYNVIKGADLYRNNLSDEKYLSGIWDKGVNQKNFIIGKMIWTWILAAITVTEYVTGMVLMSLLAFKKLPGVSDEVGTQGFFGGLDRAFGDSGPLTIFLSYITILFVIAGITAMTYLAFELCYRYFMRGRYAMIASIMTLFCIFWIVWKIFDFIVPEKGIPSIIGTSVYAIVIGVVSVIIHLVTAPKINKSTIEK